MGIVRPEESQRMEIEEFCQMLLSCADVRRRKDEDAYRDRRVSTGDDAQEKLVCVTSGVSFLGLAIVNQLLVRGYSVRITVDNQEDVEKLREMEMSGEMRGISNIIEAVVANLSEAESLSEAFHGCCGVFHTTAFIDPAGLSGYNKYMAEIEVTASENVTKACAVTPSVRNCVFTSSLLACVWRDNSSDDISPVIDHDCWSNESFCADRKLWYALGKLKAEKAAWRVAEERGLKLATICPGLIIGPEFCQRNPTSTIAYLKGAQEMYRHGLLATVDVTRLAEAQVYVFEAMNKTAFGRYICFDQVIGNEDEVEKLAEMAGIQINMVSENTSSNSATRFKLSNTKLSRLMTRTLTCNSVC